MKMRNAFLLAVLIPVVCGCVGPRIYMLNSTTWMVTYKYATAYPAGFDESKKAAVIHCKEYGKNAELESLESLEDFTSVATFYCK
jgi:hypothetical protein